MTLNEAAPEPHKNHAAPQHCISASLVAESVIHMSKNQTDANCVRNFVLIDDLWDALQEYPEAKKMLMEKGKEILMKVCRI